MVLIVKATDARHGMDGIDKRGILPRIPSCHTSTGRWVTIGGVGEVRTSPGKKKSTGYWNSKHEAPLEIRGTGTRKTACTLCSALLNGFPCQRPVANLPPRALIPLEVHFQESRILFGSDGENPEQDSDFTRLCVPSWS